jgi:NAD(P)-dependent dehydrogenase (short-subunit alcohol dehydrogenase family)
VVTGGAGGIGLAAARRRQDAPVTLVIAGGTGAYADAGGYGTPQPTATGSDVTLHLVG